MDGLTERQRDILDYLLRTELLASVENISDEFGIPPFAVKEDLYRLKELGYISELGECGEEKLYRPC